MSFIRLVVQKFGVDKAIAYSSGSRVVQGFAGLVSVLFISTFLTEEGGRLRFRHNYSFGYEKGNSRGSSLYDRF